MPKNQEHAKNIPDAGERRRTFILDTVQNHEIICFLAVRRYNIAYSVVHVQFLRLFMLPDGFARMGKTYT